MEKPPSLLRLDLFQELPVRPKGHQGTLLVPLARVSGEESECKNPGVALCSILIDFIAYGNILTRNLSNFYQPRSGMVKGRCRFALFFRRLSHRSILPSN